LWIYLSAASLPFRTALAQSDSMFMPKIPLSLPIPSASLNQVPPHATCAAGVPPSRPRYLLAKISWMLAAGSAWSPALHQFWHAAADSGRTPVAYAATVAVVCFSLAGASFAGSSPVANTWDDYLIKVIAHFFAIALWALALVMEYAVFFS
jgi:hypothetical protein